MNLPDRSVNRDKRQQRQSRILLCHRGLENDDQLEVAIKKNPEEPGHDG